jgi:hypothetical protein
VLEVVQQEQQLPVLEIVSQALLQRLAAGLPDHRNVVVHHLRDGKLTETWLLSENQYAADEFFS